MNTSQESLFDLDWLVGSKDSDEATVHTANGAARDISAALHTANLMTAWSNHTVD